MTHQYHIDLKQTNNTGYTLEGIMEEIEAKFIPLYVESYSIVSMRNDEGGLIIDLTTDLDDIVEEAKIIKKVFAWLDELFN